MKIGLLVSTFAMGLTLLPGAALADDPHDPTMRSAAARARDSAIIKRMNQQQLAYVRQRDAKTMQAYREARRGRDGELLQAELLPRARVAPASTHRD